MLNRDYSGYCKFGNVRDYFVFRYVGGLNDDAISLCITWVFFYSPGIFTSRNVKITLSFLDIGKSCLDREFSHH